MKLLICILLKPNLSLVTQKLHLNCSKAKDCVPCFTYITADVKHVLCPTPDTGLRLGSTPASMVTEGVFGPALSSGECPPPPIDVTQERTGSLSR